MIGKNNTFNYEKIFFRRPYFSELNVLFFKSLALTVISFGLFVTIFTLGFYNKFPEHRIRHEIKQNYISQIVAYYENTTPIAEEADAENAYDLGYTIYSPDDPELVIITEENVPEGTSEVFDAPDATAIHSYDAEADVKREQKLDKASDDVGANIGRGNKEEYDASMMALLPSATETGLNVMDAIDKIPARIDPTKPKRNTPMSPYNARKKAYDSSVRQYSQTIGGDVTIAETKFTDFNVIQGKRDYEETIAVANENTNTIKPCLERIYRKYPTLKGQFVVKFDVHPKGYVMPQSVKIVESDIQDIRILNCIKRSIRRWKNFPEIDIDNGVYAMTQKFVF